jgi:hypothetical protein
MHELVHAELCELGYRQRNDYDENLEEMLCDMVGRMISHGWSIRRKPGV